MIVAVDLTCDCRTDPTGIDTVEPALSWKLAPNGQRRIRQTAYRILVASDDTLLAAGQADLWDSGTVVSRQCIQIPYGGRRLDSRQRCVWKVQVCYEHGGRPEISAWSEAARWSMGLLLPQDWQASWIKADDGQTSPQMRTEFVLPTVPERALVYVNVKGYCELQVNGVRVGEDVLSPAVAVYGKRTLYNIYDITAYLRAGVNCLGAWLGLGLWYRRGEANPDPVPLARIQLEVEADGRRLMFKTNADWTWRPSSHTEHWWDWNRNGREEIDARLESPGWSDVGCAVGTWKPVQVWSERTGVATAQACPPNRITRTIPAVSARLLAPNTVELDFGTNLTGWLRLRLPSLQAGDQVTIHFADKRFQSPDGDATPIGRIGLFEEGCVRFAGDAGQVCYQTHTQRAHYIAAGLPDEVFCPKFTYYAFRYAIVEGVPACPDPADAVALMIESDLKQTGSFVCSDTLLNEIHRMNLWTMRCLNLGGYMVDCPHRERMGYGGDGQTSIESQIMNLDAAAFYAKWATDWLDVQDQTSGKSAQFSPKNDDPGCWLLWGGLIVVLPWKLYLYFGNRKTLEQAYGQMVRYVDCYVESFFPNSGLVQQGGDSGCDWVAPGYNMQAPPGTDIFTNCYRVYLLDMLAKSAEALGLAEEAERYAERARTLGVLVHTAYYNEGEGGYAGGRQLSQAMPLLLGIVPEAARTRVAGRLEHLIRVANSGHLDTGMLGTYFLFDALRQTGRNDLAYLIATQTTFPGWGYLIAQGATTFPEQWDGYWSQIHACYLNPSGWCYQGLAGILPHQSDPGFARIIIKPYVPDGVQWVRCHHDSMHGRIVSDWRRDGRTLIMTITVPPNTTAEVHVRTEDLSGIQESGRPASDAEGVAILRMDGDAAVISVGSGSYCFTSTLPQCSESQ